jgi:hypothetical protein
LSIITWKREEYEAFFGNILKDTATIEEHTATVSKHLERYTEKSRNSDKTLFSSITAPTFKSGTQWIMPGQLAMLVVLRINAKQNAKAVIRNKKDDKTEEISLEVGSVLLLYEMADGNRLKTTYPSSTSPFPSNAWKA